MVPHRQLLLCGICIETSRSRFPGPALVLIPLIQTPLQVQQFTSIADEVAVNIEWMVSVHRPGTWEHNGLSLAACQRPRGMPQKKAAPEGGDTKAEALETDCVEPESHCTLFTTSVQLGGELDVGGPTEQSLVEAVGIKQVPDPDGQADDANEWGQEPEPRADGQQDGGQDTGNDAGQDGGAEEEENATENLTHEDLAEAGDDAEQPRPGFDLDQGLVVALSDHLLDRSDLGRAEVELLGRNRCGLRLHGSRPSGCVQGHKGAQGNEAKRKSL
jgi:hypothetical protein